MCTANEMRAIATEVMANQREELFKDIDIWLENEISPRIKTRASEGEFCLKDIDLPLQSLDAEDYIVTRLNENGFYVIVKNWKITINW